LPTKSAGRVSIRVLPDSSRFREDLKLSLERIEKTMKATIPAHLEVTRESIRRLKEQLRDLEVRIKVEPYVTEEQLHHLKERVEEVDPNLRVDLDALNAQRRLAFISRDRTVSLFVKVNRASAVAAGQTLLALSGARVVGQLFEGFFRNLKDLDKNAPRIATMATAITGLGASVLALISNFGGLIGSFAELGKVAVLGPAIFSAVGISVGVLIAAFKDMKKVLKDLAPGFHELQNVISARFWDQAAGPIRNMVNNLMPQLKESLGDVAESWGRLFGKMSQEIERNVTPKELAFMMGNLSRAIDIASKAMAPLVRAFNTLGRFGSTYLPRLANFLVDISKKFDNFIQKADKNGKLKEWADEGIKAMKDLGKVIYQTGRVFASLNRAAERAGGAGFEQLAAGLKKLADLMNTESFQKTFETIFAGAHKAMDGLFEGIGNVGRGLAVLAPTLSVVFSEVGQILARVGDALAELFADPTLNQGIKDFFSGFKTFIDELKPAMGPLGRIIGTLATALGSLLAQAAPLVVSVLKELAPIFEELWKTIQPLLPDLFALADTLIKELGPILLTFVKEVLPPLIPILKDLIPLVADLVKAASPVIIDFFKKFGHALEVAGPHIRDAAVWMDDMVRALRGFPLALFQFFTEGDKVNLFNTLFKIAVEHPEVVGFFTALNTALGGLFDKIGGAADAIKNFESFSKIVQALLGAAGIIVLTTAISNFLKIGPLWDGLWAMMTVAVEKFLASVPVPVRTALAGLSILITIFTTTNKINWDRFWQSLPGVVTTYLTLANKNVGGGLGAIGIMVSVWFVGQVTAWQRHWGTIAVGAAAGILRINGGVNGQLPTLIRTFAGFFINATAEWNRGWAVLTSLVGIWFARVKASIDVGVAIAVTAISQMPGKMVLELFQWVGSFFEAGASLIGAFVQGITSGVNPAVSAAIAVVKAAMSVLPHSPAEKGPLSGQGWINLKRSGAAVTKQWTSGFDPGLVQRKSADTVRALAFASSGTSASSVRSAVGVRDERALVSIAGDYYGATPEKVADEFDKKLKRASLVAQLGKVGI
jgi:hypothetical protein